MKSAALLQRKKRGLAGISLGQNQATFLLSIHHEPFAALESGNVLMKLDTQAGLIIPGIAALRFRPLEVFQLKKLPFITS
ncbi:MAG: hypothetical protein DME19_01570 [Verrucomicrobia bacterium]|nr:MAG: hypothetical protein DME19_01570 [Verrucomicrobiota bacterium]